MISIQSIEAFGIHRWDQICDDFSTTLNHYSYFLDYLEISFNSKNCSYVVLVNGEPVVLVPFFEPFDSNLGPELILNGEPYSSPVLVCNLDNDDKIEILRIIRLNCERVFQKWNQKTKYVSSAWSILESEKGTYALDLLESLETAETIRMDLLVDLSVGADTLINSMSRSHFRTYNRSIKSGHSVIAVDHKATPKQIEEYFSSYQMAHFVAAGRATRPQSSFDFMKELILLGRGVLFVCRSSNRNLSYLFCDYNDTFSRGWSQANSDHLQPGEFPRVITELNAMLYFMQKGVQVYHLGIQEITLNPTNDLEGILEFKRRFHPVQAESSVYSIG